MSMHCFFSIFMKTGTNFFPYVGSLFIFSIWNWQPSKIFMSYVGSPFLGASLTGLLFSTENINLSIGTLLVCTPLMMDSCYCVIRRKINNGNIVKAHKKHLFQRLTQSGFSHQKTNFIYLCGTIFIGFAFLFFNIYIEFIFAFIVGLIGIFIDKKYAVTFKNCS